jgi:isochorismate pyruvate lyase
MKTPSACRNLEDVRAAVNAIDRDLVKLLGKRAKYAMAALRFKTDLSQVAVPAHRKRLFAQRREWAAAQDVNPRMVREIFQAIVDESRRLHLAGFRARGKSSRKKK